MLSEAKTHQKHEKQKILRTEAKGFTCGVTFPTGGFRYEVCNEYVLAQSCYNEKHNNNNNNNEYRLQTLDSQGVIGGYNLNQAKNANKKWCKYDASKTDADENFVYLEIRLRVVTFSCFLVSSTIFHFQTHRISIRLITRKRTKRNTKVS